MSETSTALWDAAAQATRFFMGDADVQRALSRLSKTLEAAGIPYAIAGAMALNAHGYRRVTDDVDVLLTPDGLAKLKALVLGLDYVEKFPGSKSLRDTENGVGIDVLLAGEYPGDGLPKPVRFPDPATLPCTSGETAVVPLALLLEMKLASGMSAPHRLKDLADVLELVRIRGLPEALAESLDPSVRAKYRELWTAAQAAPRDE